jgi:hypothetical protein
MNSSSNENSRNPRIFKPRSDISELNQLLEEWAGTLSDEERESALRILRPSDETEEATPTEERGDTGETR